MAVWQRPVRFGLATFAIAFGVAVVALMRDRTPSTPAQGVDRADAEAVIQTRGARIVQREASEDSLRVNAGRYQTYADETVKLLEDVTVVVPARDDRFELRLTGDEATILEATVRVTGRVTIASGDGLEGTTTEATHDDADGVVVMPGPSTFRRGALYAEGSAARFDRRADVLYLEPDAVVELQGTDRPDDARTRITARAAVVAQEDGYMAFRDSAVIHTRTFRMRGRDVWTGLGADGTRVEQVELTGDADITGSDDTPGAPRSMSAPAITVRYGADAPERIDLTGGAHLELHGPDRATAGATVRGRVMEVRLGGAGTGVDTLTARDAVVVELPPTDTAVQRIESTSLDLGPAQPADPADTPSLQARFDGNVTYEETPVGSGTDADVRTMRAAALDARLEPGLAGVRTARFIGQVDVRSGVLHGQADEAVYDLGEDTFTLLVQDDDGRVPWVDDRRGSLQAQTIVVRFDGPDLEGTGDVESVLASVPRDQQDPAASAVRRPSLLDDGPPIYVTAERFSYEADLERATYRDEARLWQQATEFRGDTLILHESTGNVSADGSVRTRSVLWQRADETGEPVETTTRGRAAAFVFDDALRRATYTEDAELLVADRFRLEADVIEVRLRDDARTLDRIVGDGSVTLTLANRRVVGTSLTYFDSDGRYEMRGVPVRIVEDRDGECRATEGRTVTFYRSSDAISVDGQSELRTSSTNEECSSF